MDRISKRRKEIYQTYAENLRPLQVQGVLQLPQIPSNCQSNFHLFHVIVESAALRDAVLEQMRQDGVRAVFHYVPLHASPKGRELVGDVSLPVTEDLSSRLIRMPFYYDMTDTEQQRVIECFVNALSQARLS
jgi:dTDP-4-amino-4,6-dideoxygalactose transaminase